MEAVARVGVIIPLRGPAGLFGPSSRYCAALAADEINERGGLDGRPISLLHIDGGLQPSEVGAIVKTLIDNQVVVALVGMHDSDVRRAVIDANKGRIPYIYTPTYEGGEMAEGVFALGETPEQQVRPIMPALVGERGIRRWYFIGNDYIWPHRLHAAAKKYICDCGGSVVAQHYLSFDTEDFDDYLEDIAEKAPDGVLVSLVGASAVQFNRAFAAAGLSGNIIRFGPLTDENVLLAIGPESTGNLLAASGYFPIMAGRENSLFHRRYMKRYGSNAPVITFMGQSCYDGLLTLEALAREACTLSPRRMSEVSEGLVIHGPRGRAEMRGRHTVKDIYLAAADGVEFRIMSAFERVHPF